MRWVKFRTLISERDGDLLQVVLIRSGEVRWYWKPDIRGDRIGVR